MGVPRDPACRLLPTEGVRLDMTVRLGLRMRLLDGMADEYARRHAALWPEMARALRDHGVVDYSIHLDESDGSVFACVDVQDEAWWADIARTPACQRWWEFMAPLMEVEADRSPTSSPLRQVFRFP